MDMAEKLQGLAEKKNAILQGDKDRVLKQHSAGKSTARERALKLFDAGSFAEIEGLREESHLVAGCGTVNGQPVYLAAQDYASRGGAMTREQAAKIVKTLRLARVTGSPAVLMLDSDGVQLEDGAEALAAYARVANTLARLSGVCPMIGCVMGPARGMAAVMAQLCDVTVQVKKTGETALHTALVMNSEKGKQKDGQQLFGADVMNAQGAAAFTAENEEEAIALTAALIDLLPASNMEDAPLADGDDLNRLTVCDDPENVDALIQDLLDEGRVLELYKAWGGAVKTVLGRLGGRAVGVVATDPTIDGGRLTAADCRKAARLIRLCDCYQLPVITLVNTAGIAVPAADGQGDLLRAAADLVYAYAEATAPKAALFTGSAVGAAYVALGGSRLADMSYAWPTAMISPLTAEAAVQALNGKELNAGESREALEAAYAEKNGAFAAARSGIVDDVIEPRESRKYLIAALEVLAGKQDVNLPKKHGNLPL